MKKLNQINSQSGQTIISVLMGAVITSSLMFAILGFMQTITQNRSKVQTDLGMNLIDLRFKQFFSNKTLIYNMLTQSKNDIAHTENQELFKCLTSTLTCTASINSGFYFKDTNNMSIAGIKVTDPIRYDVFGNICQTASTECIFEVSTSYTATCPGTSTTCNGNQSTVYVHYEISTANVASLVNINSRSLVSQEYNATIIINPSSFVGGSCSAGNYAIGLNSDGSPICTRVNGPQVRSPCTMPAGSAYPGQLGQVFYGPGASLISSHGIYSHLCCIIQYWGNDTYPVGITTDYNLECANIP